MTCVVLMLCSVFSLRMVVNDVTSSVFVCVAQGKGYADLIGGQFHQLLDR